MLQRLFSHLAVSLALGFLLLSVEAWAAPDCGPTASAIDTAICGDDTLLAADSEMTRLYQLLLSGRPETAAEQVAWLSEIRDPCEDSSCLSDRYLARINALETLLISSGQSATIPPALAAPVPPPRFKASFDCSGQLDRVAVLICTDETIAAADIDLDRLLRGPAAHLPDVGKTQMQWIADVRNRCTSTECLSRAYLQRISALEDLTGDHLSASEIGNLVPKSSESASTDQSGSTLRALGGSPLFWIFMVWLLIFTLGAARVVVICFDGADVVWAVSPLVLVLTGFAAVSALGPADGSTLAGMNFNQKIAAVAAGFAVTFATLKNFESATRHNRSLLIGLPVGIFRLTVLPIGAMTLLATLAGSNSTKTDSRGIPVSRPRTAIQMLLIIGFLTFMFAAICNGHAVYRRRGWNIPGQ